MVKRNFYLLACTLIASTTFTSTTITSKTWAVTPTKLVADANGAGTAKTSVKGKVRPKAAIDTTLESTALTLVDDHLPALKPLLEQLSKDNPRHYNMAVRDLVKSARKLESAKNRDEELYEIEVELLKTQSNLKLLTAKLKVRDSESDRDSLREAAVKLHDAEVAKAKYYVRSMSLRLERAEQQLSGAKKRLDNLENIDESRLEKSYAALLREAGREPAGKASAKSSRPKKNQKPK